MKRNLAAFAAWGVLHAVAPAQAGEPPGAGPTSLSTLTVVDTADDESYASSRSSAATKTDTPLLETPAAVQVVPVAVIEDRAERAALDAVRVVSGVQPSTYQFYDQYFIRGFDSGYGTTFRNGLQLRGINEAVNMAFVDRIEVVKGPASMLYGRIEPGGFVNVVTKRPEATSAYSVALQGGSWGFARLTADATGKVLQDGSLLYRVTGDVDRSDSWVRNAHRDNSALAASLAWKPNEVFQASLQLEHYDYKTTWLDAGIPIVGNRPAAVARDFTILLPESWSQYPYRTGRSLVSYEWSLALGDTWMLTNRFHYVHSNEDQQGVYATWWEFDGAGAFPAIQFTHNPDWIRSTVGTNLDLTGAFATGALRHKLLVGVDWARFTDDSPGSTGDIPGSIPLAIASPAYPSYSAILATLAASDATNVVWRDRSKDAGAYVQDQISIGESWDVLLGGRYDRATDAYSDTYGDRSASCYPHCTGYPVVAYPTDSAFSPRAGLLYRLSKTASLYASYSKSFGSANGRDTLGNALKAQIGTQYEVGFKASLLNDALTASATLFTLTKSNILEYDPATQFPRLVGEARSRGLELDIAGRVTEHLSLIGSYTYDQATITKDPYNGNEGHRLSGVAPQMAAAWAKWELTPDAPSGWAFGAGVTASAQRQGDDANSWQVPGFGRVDALVAYHAEFGHAKLVAQLNVNNLLDRTYFDRGGSGVAAYGAPRTVIGTLRVGF